MIGRSLDSSIIYPYLYVYEQSGFARDDTVVKVNKGEGSKTNHLHSVFQLLSFYFCLLY
jgi:hypothetical protein